MRFAAAMSVAVVLSACAPGATPSAESPSSAPAAPAAPAAASEAPSNGQASAVVPPALDWSVAQLGGGQIEGGDLVGGDVVLWFWAPW